MKEVFIVIQTIFPFGEERVSEMAEGENNAKIIIVEKGYNVNDEDSAKKLAAVMEAYGAMYEEDENVIEEELIKNARKIYGFYDQKVIEAKIPGDLSYPTYNENMVEAGDAVISIALENL